MNKLLKDAIADAKAVRETALANAKLALEEAFAPKLQSMLSSKIREEMDDEMESESYENETDPNADRRDVGHSDTADDVNMESRFKSLAGISEEEGEEESEEDFSDESEEDYSDEGGEEEFSSEEEFSDEGEGEEDFSDESDEDLEEILRELDAEEGEEEMAADEESDMDIEEIINALREEEGDEGGEGMDSNMKNTDTRDIEEEVDLQELLNSLNEEEEEEEEEKEEKMDEAKKMKMKMKKMEEEINEAYSAVKFLRTKLSEVNLLNAKLLYVNKLFRNNLTETQKVKIIETFDRAKTVREAKLVYATLSESITAAKGSTNNKATATKKSVMEGFASKATAKTKSVLTEGNDQANRFKKLAGII